ncbi:MAG: peptidylprolyl isomerase [Actinomycetota bacterium]|nr:peptidylprolyl isomerase [Actinomycetota bacterium]
MIFVIASAGLVAACGDDTPAATQTTGVADANDGLPGADPTLGDPTLGDASIPDGTGECAPPEGSSVPKVEFAEGPAMCLEAGVVYTAVIETNHGTLRVVLRPDIAPITVNSFVNLARFHYFDDTTCHRAVQHFVVQCGDPTGTGTGGPGYEFVDELAQIEPYRIGSVAMANHGPNTNGSQFFIITGDDGTMLDPNYTLFGQVDDNDLSMVAALEAISNPADGPPLEPIDILSVVIEER